MRNLVTSSAPIAILCHSLGGGGAERRLVTLANRFVELGRRVDVLTLDPSGAAGAMLSPAVRVIELGHGNGGLLTVLRAPRLARYLRRERPSVLMSGITNSHALAVVGVRLARTATPLVLRASRHPLRPIPASHRLKALVEHLRVATARRCYAAADAIVAVSAGTASGLGDLLGRTAPPIEIIYNPVIAALAAPIERPPASEPLVLGIGRFVLQKDFPTLIRAVALARRSRPLRLALLGAGRLRGEYAALAAALAVPLALPGEVADVPAWLTAADLLVSSSRWEGLQATLVEALAAGCPVVATDAPGGARETLLDGALGPLVPVGEPDALAAAMLGRLAAPRDAAGLVAGATRFTAAGKAEAYLALFDGLIGARRG